MGSIMGYSYLLVLLASAVLDNVRAQNNNQTSDGKNEFDFFVFAQTWPQADCDTWKERNKENTCDFPTSKIWTIHGLWPTKNGEIGPLDCHPEMGFDPEKIKPLLSDLREEWTNVHKNSGEFDFWKHEWIKHGTCAISNPMITDEQKYFEKGLQLHFKYPLAYFLSQSSILPGAGYTYDQFSAALKKFLSDKNPAIECAYDHLIKDHVITQISICLDKQFQLIDCDKVHGGLNQGCADKNVLYLHVPDHSRAGFYFGVGFTGLFILITVAWFGARAIYLRRQRLQRGYENI